MPYKAEICHALSHDQYFLEHHFFRYLPLCLKLCSYFIEFRTRFTTWFFTGTNLFPNKANLHIYPVQNRIILIIWSYSMFSIQFANINVFLEKPLCWCCITFVVPLKIKQQPSKLRHTTVAYMSTAKIGFRGHIL